MLPRLVAFTTYLAALSAASSYCHSTSGLLVTGGGLVLLLDGYLFQLFTWPVRAGLREALVRGGAMLVGFAAATLARPGVIPWWEAAWCGWAACAGTLFVDRLGRCRRAAFALLLLLAGPVVAALHPLHTVPKRTPAAFGLAFEDVRFVTEDGVRLAAWVIPHPQARGTVIFCHGHGRNRGHVAGLVETLYSLGLNIVAFDFRGHGESDGHTCTFGKGEVRDVVAAARYVEARFPGRPLFLVGVSLGAAVSLQALPHLPGVAGVWAEGCLSRFEVTAAHQFLAIPDPLRRALLTLYDGLAWLDGGFVARDICPVACLAGVRTPICFCHGERDELVPFSQGQELYAAYGGPKSHYWVPGASHYNVRQGDRATYLQRLRTFLEGRLALIADGNKAY